MLICLDEEKEREREREREIERERESTMVEMRLGELVSISGRQFGFQ